MLQTTAAKGLLHSSHDTDSSLNVVKPALVCASAPALAGRRPTSSTPRPATSCSVLLRPAAPSLALRQREPPATHLDRSSITAVWLCCCSWCCPRHLARDARTAATRPCSFPLILPLTPYARAVRLPSPSCAALQPRDYNPKPRKGVVRMDPDCAICHAPASLACECEAKSLEVAVRQAESRMMQSILNDIRSWVRAHAQDYILEYFRLLTERRKAAHAQHLDRLSAHSYHYYHAPPHPNEIAAAQAQLKRGIDEDWQASVQRYPEVLEYFYSLVELSLPDDNEPAVKDPPLSALSGPRNKPARRPGAATTVASGPSLATHERDLPLPRGRTPPPLEPPRERRTPGPRDRRQSYRGVPPPPPSYYPPPY